MNSERAKNVRSLRILHSPVVNEVPSHLNVSLSALPRTRVILFVACLWLQVELKSYDKTIKTEVQWCKFCKLLDCAILLRIARLNFVFVCCSPANSFAEVSKNIYISELILTRWLYQWALDFNANCIFLFAFLSDYLKLSIAYLNDAPLNVFDRRRRGGRLFYHNLRSYGWLSTLTILNSMFFLTYPQSNKILRGNKAINKFFTKKLFPK